MHALGAISMRHALSGDALAAVATAWAADVVTLQCLAWERIVVVSQAPQGPLFRTGDQVIAAMGAYAMSSPADFPSALEVVQSARLAMSKTLDGDLSDELQTRFLPLDHLAGLIAPTVQEVHQGLEMRLGGMKPARFVAARRAEAAGIMAEALQQRVRGNTAEAISSAYEADMRTLEAYLVESAVAIGDANLMSVQIRWDLAKEAVTTVPHLPHDVTAAVSLVRRTLMRSLGSADGWRLGLTWEEVA